MNRLLGIQIAGTLSVLGSWSPAFGQSEYERIEPSPKELAKLQSLTPADFAKSATIEDDDLEPVVTITTIKGYANRGKFTDRVRSDNFLRALIDKRSGALRYQVYQEITYSDVWRNFRAVNYITPDGPQTAPLVILGNNVPKCYGGACVYHDAVAFDVSEPLLQTIAAQYSAGQPTLWRFRFKSQAGLDWEDRMSPAEVAGLLQAVSDYRSTHHLAK